MVATAGALAAAGLPANGETGDVGLGVNVGVPTGLPNDDSGAAGAALGLLRPARASSSILPYLSALVSDRLASKSAGGAITFSGLAISGDSAGAAGSAVGSEDGSGVGKKPELELGVSGVVGSDDGVADVSGSGVVTTGGSVGSKLGVDAMGVGVGTGMSAGSGVGAGFSAGEAGAEVSADGAEAGEEVAEEADVSPETSSILTGRLPRSGVVSAPA